MSVEEIVAKVFSLDPAEVKDSYSKATIAEWDSMGHLSLITELERQYHINISIADSMEMASIGRIKEVLRAYGVDL